VILFIIFLFTSITNDSTIYRFKEDVGDIARLREKEKGDWKKLTKEISTIISQTGLHSFQFTP
jgi:hypothetical protein